MQNKILAMAKFNPLPLPLFQKDALDHFSIQFGRLPLENEKHLINFLSKNTRKALIDNCEYDRYKITASLLLAVSSQDRYDYSMSEEVFGKNPKRKPISSLIRLFFDKKTDEAQALMDDLGDSTACSDDEKSALRDFCFSYVAKQSRTLYNFFTKKERDLLHEKFPDLSSLCKRSIDLKGSLGIDEDDFVLPKTKGEVAANPIGYTLRESTLRTSITIDLPPTTKPKPKSSGQLKRSREAAEL